MAKNSTRAHAPEAVAEDYPPLRPTRRIHRRIADQLGIDIVSGRHPPGAVLPKEVQASAKLRVSRTAYREAVRILTAKGLVESRPKAGTRVSQRHRWNFLDPDVLAWVFSSEPSEDFVRALFELREMVEPQAAALAAQRRTPEQLARMERALEQMIRHSLSAPEGRAADEAFHAEILKAAGNEPLLSLSSSICAAIRWTTIFKQRRRRVPRDSSQEHRRLYAAIAEGNAQRAADAARELIQSALQDTRSLLEGGDTA
ncbi:MAG TPA: FadR/GntR family transcriptional regulator [Steroidobacteraceae bacterium]|nr:FadR/GntR family transcriptional regulator [Steroidobacteraceae bacterium]